MNRNEKYVARLVTQQRILQAVGFTYQDLFSLAMEQANSNFVKIKPQGALGDRKNDGYDPTTGTYYQVYSPEDLSDIAAAGKLTEDFAGLKSYWDGFSQIQEFIYVVNDRYRGSYPTIERELGTLRVANPSITFKLFRAKDIEDIILGLTDEKLLNVTGFLGDIKGFGAIDITALGSVIRHLLKQDAPEKAEQLPEDPDFEKKLVFNGLTKPVATRLRAASYQTNLIDEYFEVNSAFVKDDLKLRFAELYSESAAATAAGPERSDSIFFAIWEKASPDSSMPVRAAVLILMAYYFEYCDIFETPTE